MRWCPSRRHHGQIYSIAFLLPFLCCILRYHDDGGQHHVCGNAFISPRVFVSRRIHLKLKDFIDTTISSSQFRTNNSNNNNMDNNVKHSCTSFFDNNKQCWEAGVGTRDMLRLKMSQVIDMGSDEDDEDDDDNEEENEEDIYSDLAKSEFSSDAASSTSVDWGGALGKLRERMGDIKQGKTGPSNVLFRILASDAPNEAIMKFVREAKSDVVTAMSGAVGSLLGGLSNPTMGVETIVRSDGDKLANLCFQLQMTGYMFRNAEYVIALKDLMKIEGAASLAQFKKAFDRLDKDESGYIESSEIEALLADVYEDSPPKFEVETFMSFFDSNKDGKVSWEEFEKGLGFAAKNRRKSLTGEIERLALPGDLFIDDDNDDIDEEDQASGLPEQIAGVVEVELPDGKKIEIEAIEYIRGLKEEAQKLKQALREEAGISSPKVRNGEFEGGGARLGETPMDPRPEVGGIAQHIASLGEKNVKKLTEGISSEVINAMKLLVDYVLDRGGQAKAGQKKMAGNKEMEIAGSALQQLALWQLVLGYRLREQEATGEWRNMLDD